MIGLRKKKLNSHENNLECSVRKYGLKRTLEESLGLDDQNFRTAEGIT